LSPVPHLLLPDQEAKVISRNVQFCFYPASTATNNKPTYFDQRLTNTMSTAIYVSYYAKDPKTGEPYKFDVDYYLNTHMQLVQQHW